MRNMRNMYRALVLAVTSILLLGACGNDADPGDGESPAERVQTQASSQGEQQNGGCPSRPAKLVGHGGAGSRCGSYGDCEPVCCACSAATSRWLAAACVDGVCASTAAVCARTESSFWCGESVSRDSGPDLDDGSEDPPTVATECVAGTASSCYGSGKHWTGALCCVDGPAECVAGTASSCYGSGKHWTGALCCVDGPATCVDGTASSCYGSGVRWTGSSCCIDGGASCVAGTASSCYGSQKKWTGKVCCIK